MPQDSVLPAASAASSVALFSESVFGAAEAGNLWIPPNLIGGRIPHVPNREDEMVWQVASEACDTERVHYVWSAHEGAVWYLAAPSADFASASGTWCVLAALLPGTQGSRPGPLCYMLKDRDAAILLVVGRDHLNVFRNDVPTIVAKAERVAEDLGGVDVVDVLPLFEQLRRVEWRSASRLEDQQRRSLTRTGVIAGLGVAALAAVVWLGALAGVALARSENEQAIVLANQSATKLLQDASGLAISPARRQLIDLMDLNERLLRIGGWLQVYQISKENGGTSWKAIVPPTVTADVIEEMGGKTVEEAVGGYLVQNKGARR